eukprot:168693-Chlamydomonas_euryale.AAC.1
MRTRTQRCLAAGNAAAHADALALRRSVDGGGVWPREGHSCGRRGAPHDPQPWAGATVWCPCAANVCFYREGSLGRLHTTRRPAFG